MVGGLVVGGGGGAADRRLGRGLWVVEVGKNDKN